MPTGSRLPPFDRPSRSASESSSICSNLSAVRMRWRLCQRQSFQSLSATSGKNRFRKARVFVVVRARRLNATGGGASAGRASSNCVSAVSLYDETCGGESVRVKLVEVLWYVLPGGSSRSTDVNVCSQSELFIPRVILRSQLRCDRNGLLA